MTRRSNTKLPHDPHTLYLDEDVSGQRFESLLIQAQISVQNYETLLPRNKKVPDGQVIAVAAKANVVLVTTDKRMETEWIEDIVDHNAKVILLTDDSGGPIHWASALICGEAAWVRVLLNYPREPLTIKINRSGLVAKVTGEEELRRRCAKLLQAKIVRAKRLGITLERKAVKTSA